MDFELVLHQAKLQSCNSNNKNSISNNCNYDGNITNPYDVSRMYYALYLYLPLPHARYVHYIKSRDSKQKQYSTYFICVFLLYVWLDGSLCAGKMKTYSFYRSMGNKQHNKLFQKALHEDSNESFYMNMYITSECNTFSVGFCSRARCWSLLLWLFVMYSCHYQQNSFLPSHSLAHICPFRSACSLHPLLESALAISVVVFQFWWMETTCIKTIWSLLLLFVCENDSCIQHWNKNGCCLSLVFHR